MKNLKIVFGIAVIAAIIFASCSEPEEGQTWTVTFDANGGTAVSSVIVDDGATVSQPYSFKAWSPTSAGLWPASQVATWKNGVTKFDFTKPIKADITLKADWANPTAVPTADYANPASGTIITRVVNFINNPNKADSYILILAASDSNITQPAVQITAAYAQLTIIGLAATTITLEGATGNLFTVGAPFTGGGRRQVTTIALTLGNNITLAGKTTNNTALVWLRNGAVLNMETGSSITGNTYGGTAAENAGAIHVDNADFYMKGGSITGNGSTTNSSGTAGAVYIEDSSIVVLSGGSITGNTHTRSANLPTTADVYATYTTTFTLSGTATIGELVLSTSASNNANGSISGASGYNGVVNKLNLRTSNTNAAGYWLNKQVLNGGIAANVNKFTLGDYISTDTKANIDAVHKIDTTGRIVPK